MISHWPGAHPERGNTSEILGLGGNGESRQHVKAKLSSPGLSSRRLPRLPAPGDWAVHSATPSLVLLAEEKSYWAGAGHDSSTPVLLLAGPHTPTRLPYLDNSFLSYLSRETEISHLREARCLDLHQKGHWKTPKQKHILKKSSLFLTLSFKGKVVRAESKKHP